MGLPRREIQELIMKFSPWLAERFEYFRESVVSGYMAGAEEGCTSASPSMGFAEENGGGYRVPVPVDWAAADLDLPDITETIPLEAFHTEAFCSSEVSRHRSGNKSARSEAREADRIRLQEEDRRRTAEAQAGLQGSFRKSSKDLSKANSQRLTRDGLD